MNDLQHLSQLDGIQGEINRLSLSAFTQLMAVLKEGKKSPREAIAEIQRGFVGAYQAELLLAFNQILVTRIGKAELRNLNISGLKLSDRLYQHGRAVQATVFNIINDHGKGFHDARKLALQLYEGYNFRATEPLAVRAPLPKYLRAAFGDDDAFRALWNHQYTGSKLKGLADSIATGPQLAQLYARINANQIKTAALKAAYLQALDAIEKGAGQNVLSNTLRTAYHERNRYFANRIAQTELHRAYTDQKAGEIMADTGFDFVQVRLSGTHPRFDICDMHARLDKYGLGAGIYPKAHAPKPPFHPHCRCLLAPRAWVDTSTALSAGGTPREQPHAERAYLNSLSVDEARQVMGSADKLQAMRKGAKLDDILNAGKDPMYHLKRLGEFESQTKKRIVENMNDIFNEAKHGGVYSKFYNRYKNEYTKRLNKATKSFDEVIAEHELWIADPSLKLGSNPPENSVQRNIKKWQEDIERNRTYKIIIQGIIEDRKK